MSDYGQRYAAVYERLGFALGAADALPEMELAVAERRLSISVPPALREYYGVAGREVKLNKAHNRLLAPTEWTRDGRLVFMEENQAVVAWAVPIGSVPDDPHVLQGSGTPGEWYPEHPKCSEFLEVMLHWQAVLGTAWPCSGYARVEKSVQQALDQHCVVAGEVSWLRAYCRDRVALCMVPWDDAWRLFVSGSDEGTVQAVLGHAGLSWDRDFDEP